MSEDFIRNTPQQIPLAGNLAAGVRAIGEFASKPFGYDNPPGRMAFDLMGGNSLARVLDSVAYGDSKALENSPEGRAARLDIAGALPLATGLGVGASKTALRAADKLIPEAGQLNMFIGPSAKTANLKSLERAESLELEGKPPVHIWNETGWMKGKDGKWRTEISDDQAYFDVTKALREKRPSEARAFDVSSAALHFQDWQRFHPNGTFEEFVNNTTSRTPISPLAEEYAKNYSREELYDLMKEHERDLHRPAALTLKDVLHHKELYDAYPELADMPYGHGMVQPGYSGQFDSAKKSITGKWFKNHEDALNTTLHEVQHAVQHKEGFDFGASPEGIKLAKNRNYADAVEQHDHSMNAMAFKEFLEKHPGIDPELAWNMMNDVNAGLWPGKPPSPDMKAYFVTHVPKLSSDAVKHFVTRDKRILEKMRKESPPITDRDALELYMQNFGETEARATEQRVNKNQAQRMARFPLRDYDRPYDKLKLQSELYDTESRSQP